MYNPIMNNLLKTVLSLLLVIQLAACSSVSDQRPEPIRQSEYFLQSGVNAFENSDYVEATDFLTKALAHYRSIDNTEGVLLSHINLAETALAAGNFDAAEKHTAAAQSQVRHNGFPQFTPRITLLQAQTAWRRQQEAETRQLLASLLPTFDEEQRSAIRPDLVTLGAATIRTDIAFQREDVTQQRLWLKRLSLMVPTTNGNTQLHQARLLRFEALRAHQEKHTNEALEKQQEALAYYREAAARPAIASTLTEIGAILMELEHWEEAENHLQRALYIRLWIMDRIGAAKLLEMLQQVYRELGDEERYQKMRMEAEKLIPPKP